MDGMKEPQSIIGVDFCTNQQAKSLRLESPSSRLENRPNFSFNHLVDGTVLVNPAPADATVICEKVKSHFLMEEKHGSKLNQEKGNLKEENFFILQEPENPLLNQRSTILNKNTPPNLPRDDDDLLPGRTQTPAFLRARSKSMQDLPTQTSQCYPKCLESQNQDSSAVPQNKLQTSLWRIDVVEEIFRPEPPRTEAFMRDLGLSLSFFEELSQADSVYINKQVINMDESSGHLCMGQQTSEPVLLEPLEGIKPRIINEGDDSNGAPSFGRYPVNYQHQEDNEEEEMEIPISFNDDAGSVDDIEVIDSIPESFSLE
jgi:hypothetical protein